MKASCLCLLDLSAAFDTIDHITSITPHLSSWFGIHGSFFSAGLSHICHLVVSVSNVKPTFPPGTHPPAVSPKALSLVHYFSSCTPLLSAPSFSRVPWTSPLHTWHSALSILPSDSLRLQHHLHSALDRISSWMTANLLTLNSSKTEFLFIGLSNQLAKINNSSLTTTHSARNRGFIFDKHLTFYNQISSVFKSCYYHIR